jgi:hypothetical protein
VGFFPSFSGEGCETFFLMFFLVHTTNCSLQHEHVTTVRLLERKDIPKSPVVGCPVRVFFCLKWGALLMTARDFDHPMIRVTVRTVSILGTQRIPYFPIQGGAP